MTAADETTAPARRGHPGLRLVLKVAGWIALIQLSLLAILIGGRALVLRAASRTLERQFDGADPHPAHERPAEPLERDVVRVLSLDGGGIRGIISLEVLAALEEQAGKPTAELFDLIVGSSTGGIIALMLAVPGEDGRPRFSAHELLQLYHDTGREFFAAPLLYSLFTLGGLIGPKYPRLGLREHMLSVLGDVHLADLVVPVIFPAYSDSEGRPYFFRSRELSSDLLAGDDEYLVVDTILGATTVPSMFLPTAIPSTDGKLSGLFLDGAIYSPSPSLCGRIGANAMYPGKHVYMLSIGTGAPKHELGVDEIRGWGFGQWLPHLLPTIMDANATFSSEFSGVAGAESSVGISTPFVRIDRPYVGDWSSFFDVSQENVDELAAFGRKLAADFAPELETVAHDLLEIGDSSGTVAERYSK